MDNPWRDPPAVAPGARSVRTLLGPHAMKSTRFDGLYTWSVYQPDRRIDFNGFYLAGEAGGVLVDPMPLDAEQLAQLREAGGARYVLVTNADHLRAGAELAAELGADLVAPEPDRARFAPEAQGAVAAWYGPDRPLPEPLGGAFEVCWLGGGKSELEPALWWRTGAAWIFGDLVRSHESGRLRLLPAPKLSDPARAARDVAELCARPAQAVLLGDGDSLWREPGPALAELRANLEAISPRP